MTSTYAEDQPLTDLLADKLGPQYLHLVALIARASEITRETEQVFPEREDPDWDDALTKADDLVFDELGTPLEPLGEQVDLARNLASSAASGFSWSRGDEFEGLAYIPAFRAATALALRHLLPQDVYDTLSGEWRTEIGAIHPDDAAM